jgi:hypothetical protein
MTPFMHNVKIGVAGGRNCTDCHYIGSDNAPKHVNFSAMNRSDNAHLSLNNRSGDPGTTDTSGSDWNNRRCWACHSDGTNPADSHNTTKYKNPWTCPDCHTAAGAMNSVFNWSASGLKNVSEHYRSGADIAIYTSWPSDLKSCLECHEKKTTGEIMTEMLIPESEVGDPDNASSNFDGAGVSGGNYSFYHYGKKRSTGSLPDNLVYLDVGGTYSTNCSYCHQNSTTNFRFTDGYAYRKNIASHTNRTEINCTNSTCHNTGRIHDSTLKKPQVSASNDTICVTCHPSPGRERHADVNCTQCHTNTSKTTEKDIHPIKYLTQSNTFSTSNASAVNCTTCHQYTTIDGTNNLYPPKVIMPSNHSNGSKWNSTNPYWNTNEGSCDYCHGDTKHNSTALGNASGAQQAWDYLNGTINTTSTWCQDCHYSGSDNYIGSLFEPTPPEITSGSWGGVSGYYNHTLGSYNDSACLSCHGNNTLGDRMDEFMHNIAPSKPSGENPKNCSSCHSLTEEGGSGAAPKTINITAFNSTYSIHRGLNIGNGTYGPCYACHGNGTAPPDTMNHSTWPNLKNPLNCSDCHGINQSNSGNYSAPLIYQHTRYGMSEINISVECETCHNNSRRTGTGDTAESTGKLKALVSHYGTNNSLQPKPGKNTTICITCHKRQDGGGGDDTCTDGILSADASKWGNPKAVTMGKCNNSLCWACHVTDNQGLQPSETPVGPENFHRQDLDNFMWNCQYCHVID